MFGRPSKLALISWLLAISLVFISCSKKKENTVTRRQKENNKGNVKIAVLSCYDPLEEFKDLQPLKKYLSEKTGYRIELIIPKSDEDFNEIVNSKEADFFYQSSYSYVLNAGNLNSHSLLKTLNLEENSYSIRGAVIVQEDSGLKSISDLRGKTIAFGSQSSANRYLAARVLLKENGIEVSDLKECLHGQSCEDIMLNVYLKQADAGIICEQTYMDLLNKEKDPEDIIDISKIVVIGKTQPVPGWVFCASENTGDTTIAKVNGALLGLNANDPEQKEVLEGMKIAGFTEASDDDYKIIKDMVKTIGE